MKLTGLRSHEALDDQAAWRNSLSSFRCAAGAARLAGGVVLGAAGAVGRAGFGQGGNDGGDFFAPLSAEPAKGGSAFPQRLAAFGKTGPGRITNPGGWSNDPPKPPWKNRSA